MLSIIFDISLVGLSGFTLVEWQSDPTWVGSKSSPFLNSRVGGSSHTSLTSSPQTKSHFLPLNLRCFWWNTAMSSCELGHRTEMYGLEAENSEPEKKPSDSGPELSNKKISGWISVDCIKRMLLALTIPGIQKVVSKRCGSKIHGYQWYQHDIEPYYSIL